MAIFAEVYENECISERHPLIKGDNLTATERIWKTVRDGMH